MTAAGAAGSISMQAQGRLMAGSSPAHSGLSHACVPPPPREPPGRGIPPGPERRPTGCVFMHALHVHAVCRDGQRSARCLVTWLGHSARRSVQAVAARPVRTGVGARVSRPVIPSRQEPRTSSQSAAAAALCAGVRGQVGPVLGLLRGGPKGHAPWRTIENHGSHSVHGGRVARCGYRMGVGHRPNNCWIHVAGPAGALRSMLRTPAPPPWHVGRGHWAPRQRSKPLGKKFKINCDARPTDHALLPMLQNCKTSCCDLSTLLSSVAPTPTAADASSSKCPLLGSRLCRCQRCSPLPTPAPPPVAVGRHCLTGAGTRTCGGGAWAGCRLTYTNCCMHHDSRCCVTRHWVKPLGRWMLR